MYFLLFSMILLKTSFGGIYTFLVDMHTTSAHSLYKNYSGRVEKCKKAFKSSNGLLYKVVQTQEPQDHIRIGWYESNIRDPRKPQKSNQRRRLSLRANLETGIFCKKMLNSAYILIRMPTRPQDDHSLKNKNKNMLPMIKRLRC